MPDRYLQPGWFTRSVFNGAVAGLTRIGISVMGSRVLTVRGRKSGQERSVPVNLLTHAGQRYLVAPRGTTLRRWRFEVGTFFQGVGPKSSDDDLRRIAPDHPVFRVRGPA